jgi:hypothetical protein
MKGYILLDWDEDLHKVEEEEKFKFIKQLLQETGAPINEVWSDDHIIPTIDEKIKLRGFLHKYAIQIIDNKDNGVSIYAEKDLIGSWHKPIYKLKRDLSQLDPKKQLFHEMEISFWSIFELDD